MTTTARLWIVLGALSAALSVGLGAYHAHGLPKALAKGGLEPQKIEQKLRDFEVGVRYEMFHALGIIAVGLLLHASPSRLFSAAGVAFLLGTLLFSGGLYLPVLLGIKLHWAIVPTGGMAYMVGWVLMALAAVRKPKPSTAA